MLESLGVGVVFGLGASLGFGSGVVLACLIASRAKSKADDHYLKVEVLLKQKVEAMWAINDAIRNRVWKEK